MPTQHLDGLAVQGVHDADGSVAVCHVDNVVGDVDAVGEFEGTVAPGFQEVAFAVKDDNGRLFALEGKDAVLGVGGEGAHHAKGIAGGQGAPVFD